jgi:tRNA-dihydrouridine synthase 3
VKAQRGTNLIFALMVWRHYGVEILPRLNAWGCAAATLHGRTKEQRYTKEADWSYIETIAANSASVPLIGNGDVYSYQDAIEHLQAMRLDDEGDCDGDSRGVSALMLARGALIKPWLFTEIKERRHWDISSSERFDMLKDFTTYGLEHWGSDDQGVLNVRKFLM